MKQLKELGYDALSVVVLLGIDLVFFYRAVLYGEVFFERDTRVFYYPNLVAMAVDLRNWDLPLWSPNLFGGFPFFADGEAGMFYPPVFGLLQFLSDQQAFIWITVLHFFLAGLFTFLFLRALKLGRFASVLGGIAFMLGGFTVAQLHHQNIIDSAVWLPLVLCFVERALQTVGARRHVNLLLAGAAFGMQALAVHVNVVLMSLPVIVGYTAYRIVLGPVAVRQKATQEEEETTRMDLARDRDPWLAFGKRLLIAARVVLGRCALLLWASAIVPIIGLAIGAVQLLPLYELGTVSMRAGGVDRSVSASQAQTVYNLATLIFPYFFRDASNLSWGLWSQWETRIYVGILPLLLGLTALVLVRSRVVVFFAGVATLAFLVGLADSSPINLHAILSSLPGYNLIRAPGRYSYLWTFANAILAAYAANWLSNPMMGKSHFRFLRERWKPDKFLWRLPAFSFFALLAIAAIDLPFVFQDAAKYVADHKTEVLNLIQQNYLSLPRMLRPAETALTPGRVFDGLVYSLGSDNPSTKYGLTLVVISVAMLIVGYSLRRGKWLWQIAMIALVAGDLVFVGWQFHPTIKIDQLASVSPAATFLKEHQGFQRVYSRVGTSTDPNLLLSMGIAEANGYSSIPPSRMAQLLASIDVADNQLMDMLNVRYIITRNRYVPQPSYEQVAFNPSLPLTSGKQGNPASRATFTVSPTKADRIRVLSTLQYGAGIPQGTPVAEITVTDTSGKRSTVRLVAGVDTAEWAYDRLDVQKEIKHSKPAKVAFTWPIPTGPFNLYYSELRLDRSVTAQQIEIASITKQADVRVYGISLMDSPSWRVVPVTRNNEDRFKVAYRDSEVQILENTHYLPRTYLVPEVRVVDNPFKILQEMMIEPFDATRTAIVEEKDPTIEAFLKFRPEGTTPANTDIGNVTLDSYKPKEIHLTANANMDAMLILNDSYYPGWHALVDGQETKIYQADFVFRAIRVPKGTHNIEFYFAPASYQTGLKITLTAVLLVLGAWLTLRLAWLLAVVRSVLPVLRALGAKAWGGLRGRIKALFPPTTASDPL